MAGDPGDQPTTTLVAVMPMALLLCALSYATDSQGAFYPGPFKVFVILVGAALVSCMAVGVSSGWAVRVLRDPLVLMTLALSLVTVVSSVVAGQAADAVGTVSLLLTMAAAVAVVKALRPEHRQLLVGGIVVIGVVVAGIGWGAVVARWQPDALTGQGLWRAASTLTYENALAAFLTAPALLCLDRLMNAGTRRPLWSGAAFVLLVGIGASLSRGGVLGLVIGLAVLGALRGPRRLLRLGPPAVGSVIALACLAPSVPVDTPAHVGLAGAGLVVGGALAAWTGGSPRLRAGAAAFGVVVLGVLVAVVSTGHVAREIAGARLSAASSDRAREWAAAFDVARHHLLLGIGTARVLLQWEAGGKLFTAAFAHNEYLQLLVQDGLVGLVVLLLGLVGVFVRLARRRGGSSAWSADCGIACLVAFLVQSSLDFLWHIPVIPVLLAVVLATATTPPERGDGPMHDDAPKRYASPAATPAVAPAVVRAAGGGGHGTASL
jgi:O-antigen ligase